MNFPSKRLFKISIIALLLSIFLLLLIFILNHKNIYIQINISSFRLTNSFIKIVTIFTTVLSFTYIIFMKIRMKFIRVIVIIFSILFLGITFLINLILNDAEYTSFYSPDYKQKFIARETGYTEIYQMSKTGLYMKHLVNIQTNNGYKPFYNGSYQIMTKDSNELIIKYVFDYMHPDNFTEVTIKYK